MAQSGLMAGSGPTAERLGALRVADDLEVIGGPAFRGASSWRLGAGWGRVRLDESWI